jgi:tetratricopeptide (TPR) repeat protein
LEEHTVPFEPLRVLCDHLVERTATLFLGAGVNAGVISPAGITCPLGSELSEWICRDLLMSPDTVVPLDEASEMARHAVGERAVNDYLFDKFKDFKPGVVHLALVQLPWDKIYTTNFDLLVEQAASSPLVKAAGSITVVESTTADVSVLSEDDIPYYKLHGSLDIANTHAGKLILTKRDYREYETYKKPLFKRLKTDLESRTFLFVGYSLTDPNFRAVLDDCRDELGTKAFPLSYAVIKSFTPIQQQYWREKYNIELIQADAVGFMTMLKDTWISENCIVVPLLQRKASEFLQLDRQTRFQKIGDSFYLLRTADCTGQINPDNFFRGAEPTWADVRDRVPAKRDLYDPILESLFPELLDTRLEPSAYVITGAAGTGKSTLLFTLAYDLVSDFQAAVLIHIPGTPLDSRLISPLVSDDEPRRFVVVVRYASEQFRELALFYAEVVQRKLPVTLLLEDRTNQWHVAKTTFRSHFNPAEFTLGTLSEIEVDGVLDALERHGCLRRLTGLSREEQVGHFNNLADEDLLVALRELTSDGHFDQIVRDEYEKIPSEIAKRAYIYVAAIGQLDLAVRYETIIRILGLRTEQLSNELINPTEGILITGEETGSSRHNLGFRLRARHPIIASIIFATAAEDDQSKFDVINGIMSELDPGFPEDMRLLNQIMRRKELVNTLAAHAMRRAVFERLETILPGDPYVWQHRSILERDMQNYEQAIQYARLAAKDQPTNAAFSNTLGFALEAAAKNTEDTLKFQALLSEAGKLFEDGIKRDPSEPFNYLGMLNIQRQKIGREKDAKAKNVLTATSLALLMEAYEETNESPMIAGELARVRTQLGSQDEGIEIVKQALARKPGDSRLRDLLIRFVDDSGDPTQALTIAIDGAKLDPTNWRLQRWLARLRKEGTENVNAVKGHYEAAIRHHKGDVSLMVEYASYLFMKLMLPEAKLAFEALKGLSISTQERRQIRERWKLEDGTPQMFTGRIQRYSGARGTILAIPDNFEAFFWRIEGAGSAREGETVRFTVSFSAQGAEAKLSKVKVSDRLTVR